MRPNWRHLSPAIPEGRLRRWRGGQAGLWALGTAGATQRILAAFAAALPTATTPGIGLAQSRLPDLAANLVKFSQNPL